MEKELKLEIKKYIQRSEEAIDTVKLLIQYKKYSDAVSKAYYAMFYAACATLRTKTLDTSKHSSVISQSIKSFISLSKTRFISAINFSALLS